MTREITSFAEFWPFYVGEHRLKRTRQFHFVGTTVALGVLTVALVTSRPALIPLALVCGYGPAWYSHFRIERNKPATFKYPLWSVQADFIMWARMLAGTMDTEIERLR